MSFFKITPTIMTNIIHHTKMLTVRQTVCVRYMGIVFVTIPQI